MSWEMLDEYKTDEVDIGKASNKEQESAEKALLNFKEKVILTNSNLKYFNNFITHYQAVECLLNSNYSYEIDVSLLDEKRIYPENQNSLVVCNNVQSHSGDKIFKWDNVRNTLVTIDGEELCDVANFKISIKDIITEVFQDNEKQKSVILNIFYRDQIFNLKVLVEKFIDLNKEIGKSYPQCIVHNIKLFTNYAAELYGDNKKNKHNTIYRFSGWYKENGSLIYLNSSMKNVKSNVVMEFNSLKANEFLQHFMKTSSEKNKLIIILLYSLWAYFSIFYEETKIDGCRGVLYLSAPTGTGKTSLAKILSKALLTEDAKSVMRFDDTIASLEESLFNARDLLSLVDDFYAKGNKVEEQGFKAKASAITRIVGDAMIKGKMGANRKPMPDRRYRGGVIATGEYIDLNTHSSYLRCWVLNFPENSIYFNDHLTKLQQNTDLVRSFYSIWIRWLEENQGIIMGKLKIEHQKNIRIVEGKYKTKYPRLRSQIATFLTLSSFWNDFANQYNLNFDYSTMLNAIWEESSLQLNLLETMSPSEIVIKAINEALDNAYIKIAEDEDNFRKKDYDGYYGEGALMIITSRLEYIIDKYASKNNYGLKFNNDLKEILVNKKILVKDGDNYNIKYKKNRVVDPKRPRVFKINKGVLENG